MSPTPSRTPSGRALASTSATVALILTATLATAAPAAAEPTTPVISEVYGGGGNSGAELRHDFVELGNPTDAAVTLDGWSVQYLPATPSSGTRVQVTDLGGAVGAGEHYLVRLGQGAGGSVDLPTPDAAGGTAMSARSGAVLLVQGTDPVTCRTAAECAAEEGVVDIVGYGDAVVFEGSPAARLSNTTSAARDDAFTDTGNNAADLTAGAPTPTNAAGETPGDGGGDTDPVEPGDLRVHDVQGTTRTSPYEGRTVSGVPGVVTAVNRFGSARGFWFQDPEGDGDPRTSEALFVFTGSTTPDVAVGDEVLVAGRVTEYRPGSDLHTITQLSGADWTTVSSGADLPGSVRLDADAVPDAYAPDHGGDISDLDLRPDTYALDFWAAHEHMLVRVEDAPVIDATDPYSALWVTTDPDGREATVNGGTLYDSYDDPNAGRIKIESLLDRDTHPFPRANVGDTLTGVTEGPLYYSRFGGFLIRATTLGEIVRGDLERVPAREAAPYENTIATYNVENLDGADDQAKFDELARGIVDYLGSPDIIGLEEIQDDNGPVDDGTVDADLTLRRLTRAIHEQGGPRYAWRQISPEDGRDGGQPGGNIRNVFLFDPRHVRFVDAGEPDATADTEVLEGPRGPELSVSPGRIAPEDEAWESSRKPLVGHFRVRGRDLFVVTNHFNSKGGDHSLHGVVQPPERSSEVQRNAQARLVREFTDELFAVDPDANVVVMGDLNDFPFSPTLDILTGDGPLTNPMSDLPENERYNYVFDGNSQALDHILFNDALAGRMDYEIVRINSEFHDQVSDHDPQVLYFDIRGGRR
ncbi:endonuclease/exonuclease/phosphatase family protein [Nocardiopsis sp. FIRDI 009]|uniref:endonuclease/exonuclease/phosphatase family protein n=1 Tax=Nocardiopsis sp. FIRDI 009 TaxID=714197 RepID=UPI000E2752FB|nr:endonuclease/exonuclease/phosphatase family protein [Nocardiopsis sp. FIRDI 009]